MTVSADITPDITARPRQGVWGGIRGDFQEFLALVRQSPEWGYFALPYLLAWIVPTRWAWAQWTDSYAPQAFEPLILPGTLLLIWARRDTLREQWRSLTRRRTSEGSVERRTSEGSVERGTKSQGNIAVIALACALLLFAHFVQVKGLGFSALVLLFAGAIYRVYGARMLHNLAVPLLFLCLVIPPPDSPVDRLFHQFHLLSVAAGGAILRAAHLPAAPVNGTMLDFGGGPVSLPYGLSGFNTALCAGVVALWYGLYRRQSNSGVLGLVLLTTLSALGLNLVRVVAIGLTYNAVPQIGRRVLMPTGFLPVVIENWLWIAGSFVLALALVRGLARLATRGPAPLRRLLITTGRGLNLVTAPLSWLLRGLGAVGKRLAALWVLSEGATERLLSKLLPRRKRRRSSRRR